MQIPGRKYALNNGYRFGYNGKESDNNISEGDYNFGGRIYDSRIDRWLSKDPLSQKYTDFSPYQYCANSLLQAKDPDGRLIIFINRLWGYPNEIGKGGTVDYWGQNWVERVQKRMNNYSDLLFYDGSLGGTKGLLLSGGLTNIPKFRINAGEEARYNGAASIIRGLKIGETIKLVTNSMGAAFERGFTKGILKYEEEEENRRRNAYNEPIDAEILILQLQSGELSQDLDNVSIPQATSKNEQIHKQLEAINSKITKLKASKKEMLNVIFETNTDLSSHQIDYPDPNVVNSYDMTVDPKNMNAGERFFVNQKQIKGAHHITNPDGSPRMTAHHSSGAVPEDLPK